MTVIPPLEIALVYSIPEGYEPIGTLTNVNNLCGHQMPNYIIKFHKDRGFEISLENHISTFFSYLGRFKIYKNIDNPARLLAIKVVGVIAKKKTTAGSLPIPGCKAPGENLKKSMGEKNPTLWSS